MKNQQKKLLQSAIWVAFALVVLRCIISCKEICAGISVFDFCGYIGEAIGIATLLIGIYEKSLWRYNPLEKTPKLAKKYYGILKSTYDGVERQVVLEIKQSLLSVNVIMISDESKSHSLSASISEFFGEKRLTYCYLNTPKSEFRSRSQIHYGTATLTIEESGSLTGQYYTDRQTKGDINLNVMKNNDDINEIRLE